MNFESGTWKYSELVKVAIELPKKLEELQILATKALEKTMSNKQSVQLDLIEDPIERVLLLNELILQNLDQVNQILSKVKKYNNLE